MSEHEHEEPALDAFERRLLEAVPEWGVGPDAGPVDDGALMALRAGALGEAEAAALAGRLAADPEARALLIAQAETARRSESEALSVARVLSRRRRPGALLVAVGAVVALAAAVALFVARPAEPRFTLDGPFGGVADSRGEADGPTTTFVPGNVLRLFVRPAAPLDRPPACRGVVTGADGARRAVPDAFVTIAPNGVCRLQGPIEQILPGFGDFRVGLVVETDGSLPDGVPPENRGSWHEKKIEYRSLESP